jgi:pimeloyl-ACP methyl ester carboxylesterase
MVFLSRFYPLALLVAWLVCGVAAVENPWLTLPATPSLPAADSSGLLDINSVQIWHALFSTHLAGAGPTVIFLHGGLGHSEYFGLQIAEIAKYRQVLSIDSRGHGRSSRNNASFSYELMESDVVAVMDHLGLGSVCSARCCSLLSLFFWFCSFPQSSNDFLLFSNMVVAQK